MESGYLSIGEAGLYCGLSVSSLRRLDKSGVLVASRTSGNHRRYSVSRLYDFLGESKPRMTVGYARVSSHGQKADLEVQGERLMKEIGDRYPKDNPFIIRDLGSGVNYRKRGLRLLLEGSVGRLVVTDKDRLLRFGAEIVFEVCHHVGTEVVILDEKTGEDDGLVENVLSILTVYSAKLYGRRSHKNRKALLVA